MADVNRGTRPLSPHLEIYRFQMTMALSIFTRITGVGLTLAAVLVVWWFLAAGSNAAHFEVVDGLLTSWIGGLILILSLVAFWFHFCNGIRHLFWDAGHGFDLDVMQKSGIAVLVATGVLTVLTLIVAFV